MKNTSFLFVTCCLEESRATILNDVIDNLKTFQDHLGVDVTVFDNSSTIDWVVPKLKDNFKKVYVSNKNIGYWSAIDWWLNNVAQKELTYIIESDMIHYDFDKLADAEGFLLKYQDVGSIRCHEYDVNNWKIYDKDNPIVGSKRNIWQSHTNKITNKKISCEKSDFSSIFVSNFLTQLPALNRTIVMKDCFKQLSLMNSFSELDFQKLYWDSYQKTGIIDGGVFHFNLASWDQDVITGSWTSEKLLKEIGYQATRHSKILTKHDYHVACT